MVDIISKSDGPRPQDARLRKLIGDNQGTITRLADQISGGGYTMAKAQAAARRQAPELAGHLIHDLAPSAKAAPAAPYIRISPNNRVVVVDGETSKQMHFLGELRRIDGQRRFVLATKANRFFTAISADIEAQLAPLDGQTVTGAAEERALAAEIASRMGFA